jgi:hypothetical protein
MKTQLLCTFSKKTDLNETVDVIISCNEIMFDKIYVFEDSDNTANLMCTYNVEYDEDFTEGVPNTISLHRKKQTNTLYTINALNDVIRELNNGVLDKTYIIPWENYQNSILLNNESGLVKINTKLYKIVNVKTWSVTD